MSTIKSEYISHIDNTGTSNISLNSDGSTGVKGLSNGNSNVPIYRGSIDPAQTQSFYFSDNTANLYQFEPIPSWCNHVRYTVYTNLSTNSLSNGGFYLRYATGTDQYLSAGRGQYYVVGTSPTVGAPTPTSAAYNASDPLLLKSSSNQVAIFGFVLDLYFVDYYGSKISWARGQGSLLQDEKSFIVSYAQSPIVLPTNVDRMGAILYGGSVTGAQGEYNEAWVSQTFMTDGPVQEADIGITPTPILP